MKRQFFKNDDNKFIIATIPKCASTSIKLWVYQVQFGEKHTGGVCKRCNNNTIHSCVCLDELNDHEEVVGYPYKIYSIVKDPYSRILSTYINKIEDGGTPSNTTKVYTIFENYMKGVGKEIKKDKDTFGSFLKLVAIGTPGLTDENHIIPQTELLAFDKLVYTHVGRFETLDDEFEKIKKQTGIEFGLPSKDKTKGRPTPTNAGDKLDKYYNRENFDLVNKIYINDFENFKYKMR